MSNPRAMNSIKNPPVTNKASVLYTKKTAQARENGNVKTSTEIS